MIGADIDETRVQQAKAFGASQVINGKTHDPVEEIKKLTRGKGVSCAMECAGGNIAKQPAVRCTATWGRIALVAVGDMTPWGQHCSSSIVPAVFALAERQGGVSGKNLIEGVAAGQDIFARLLRFTGWKKDWNFSTAMGVCAGIFDLFRVQTK